MNPGVLLADEPTGNLDRTSGVEIIRLLEKPNANGVSLLVVTHDVNLGNRANRQLNLVDGAVVKDTRKSPLAHGAN